jgi:hypothetical protein
MPDWMAHSIQSCTQELYHVKASPEMVGSSFTHLSLCSMLMSPSLIFGVVTMHGHTQSFRPNPMDLCLSEGHILAIFANDQESANNLVAQMSLVITKLNQTKNAKAALSLIEASEQSNRIFHACNSDLLPQFLSILQEMQLNLHRTQRAGKPHEHFPSPEAAEVASAENRVNVLLNSSESSSIANSSKISQSRLSRSNTFTSPVGESFLPTSRRSSIAPGQEQVASSPLTRLGSLTSNSVSPSLKAATFSGKTLFNRLDNHSLRERRDSDSSAALSSVASRSSHLQVHNVAVTTRYPCFLPFYHSTRFLPNFWRGQGFWCVGK